jgi:carboxymethylenebutenolidase
VWRDLQRTQIHRMAMLLAGHGYLVVVPDLLARPAGTVLAYDKPGTDRGNFCKTAKPVAAYDADARAALDWLAASPHCTGKLGVMGICIGGHLAFRAAMQAGVRATACLFATDLHKGSLGQGGDDSLARTGEIRGELMMVWGVGITHPRRGALISAGSSGRLQLHLASTTRNAFLRDEAIATIRSSRSRRTVRSSTCSHVPRLAQCSVSDLARTVDHFEPPSLTVHDVLVRLVIVHGGAGRDRNCFVTRCDRPVLGPAHCDGS